MPNKPLNLSTNQVHSFTPESASFTAEVANDNKPIYIVGGGKTSMDVANLILAQNPDRQLNFITEKGTFFLNRDIFFPAGANKNWEETTITELLTDIMLNYNEDNLSSAIENIKKKYALMPFKNAKQTLIGLLSTAEVETVKKGINTEIYNYLKDVTEDSEELFVHFKNQNKQQIEAGSWFINCTGYLYPKQEELEPLLSPHETELSIQKTAFTFFLPHYLVIFFHTYSFEINLKKYPFTNSTI